MNQLLIVNSQKALNAKADAGGANVTPYDLSNLAVGAATFFELGASSVLAAAASKNFAVALGRGANMPAFVIPEIDIDTLEITKALPKAGTKFSATFTFPTPVVGKEYTVIMVKKGVVPNERNLFTTSIVAGTTTAATEGGKLVNAINAKANDIFNVTASISTAAITIAANDNTDWEIKFGDALFGTSTSSLTHFTPTIGDKAYIQALAQKCAAGKGFNLLDQASKDLYPGYPEAVEDLVPNTSGDQGISTAGYAIYSLHFATGRKSGKQVDERVWQYVYIAVPITNSSYSTFNAILPEGKFSPAQAVKAGVDGAAATTTTPGTGYLTKTVADTLYDPL